MHKIFYYTFRTFLLIGLRVYFRKIRLEGLQNIPMKGPVLFLANHQNAFLDAILIVCFNRRYSHFLARADIFKGPISRYFLSLMNLLPIYRIRDGVENLSKNEKIINQTTEFLLKDESLIMFPEGNHSNIRKVRPVSKGFTRIIFRMLEIDPDAKISIVPVGLNYESPTQFRKNVSVLFGECFQASDYNDQSGSHQDSLKLRNKVREELEKLTLHIDNDHYEKVLETLINERVDLTDPTTANRRVKQIIDKEEWVSGNEPKTSTFIQKIRSVVLNILGINNLIINLIWRAIYMNIMDPVFVGSLKYAYVLIFVPIIYLAQIFLVSIFFSGPILYGYCLLCILFPFYLKFWDEKLIT